MHPCDGYCSCSGVSGLGLKPRVFSIFNAALKAPLFHGRFGSGDGLGSHFWSALSGKLESYSYTKGLRYVA